ncbi:hypothetical protein KAX02_04745 [candidate division WOR-3 bacterium]|nr:hypothetical protein [candidate division WOR-3 bacterium]
MGEERILMDGVKYKLWTPEDEVKEFEPIVVEHIADILGSENAIFFTKQKIRTPRGIGSIPDGFAIVLDNTPHWYVIEVELSRHSPYDHAEPQAKKFKNAIQSSETRKQLVDAMYDEVKRDMIKEKLIKDKIGSGEIHKFLSDLITIDNLTLLIVLEEVTGDWREAFDDFPDVKIVEFKTFRREGASTVHAHLFKPLYEIKISPEMRPSLEKVELQELPGKVLLVRSPKGRISWEQNQPFFKKYIRPLYIRAIEMRIKGKISDVNKTIRKIVKEQTGIELTKGCISGLTYKGKQLDREIGSVTYWKKQGLSEFLKAKDRWQNKGWISE